MKHRIFLFLGAAAGLAAAVPARPAGVDTALLRRALAPRPVSSYEYEAVSAYGKTFRQTLNGALFLVTTPPQFYGAVTDSDAFFIVPEGAVTIAHRPRTVRLHAFRDSADRAAYQLYFRSAMPATAATDALLARSGIRMEPGRKAGQVLFQITLPAGFPIRMLEVEVDRTTALPVRMVSRQRVPGDTSAPKGPEQTMTVTRIRPAAPPAIAPYYDARDHFFSYCRQRYSTYTISGL